MKKIEKKWNVKLIIENKECPLRVMMTRDGKDYPLCLKKRCECKEKLCPDKEGIKMYSPEIISSEKIEELKDIIESGSTQDLELFIHYATEEIKRRKGD